MWNLSYTISPGVERVIRFIVNSDSEKPETRLSEHIVLDGTESIIHNFGYGSGTRTLGGHLLDNGSEYPLLVSGYHAGTLYSLNSDQGVEGTYRIWSLSKKRIQDVKRSTPVLQIEMELKA
jgi:hypothetical protein